MDKGVLALGVGAATWLTAGLIPYDQIGGTQPIGPNPLTPGNNLYSGQLLMASIYLLGGAVTAVLALHAEEDWLKYGGLLFGLVLMANGFADLVGKGFLPSPFGPSVHRPISSAWRATASTPCRRSSPANQCAARRSPRARSRSESALVARPTFRSSFRSEARPWSSTSPSGGRFGWSRRSCSKVSTWPTIRKGGLRQPCNRSVTPARAETTRTSGPVP